MKRALNAPRLAVRWGSAGEQESALAHSAASAGGAHALRKNVGTVVLALVMLCLCVLSFVQVRKLTGYSHGWSLRYHTPISGPTAQVARSHAVQHPEDGLWPTFWREDSLVLESALRKEPARGIWYSGEGTLVWPGCFVQGGWPGATDTAGCVVSTALAWQLWGSYDVVGKSVTIAGKPFYVRGVMDEAEVLCLINAEDAGPDGGWQAAEFRTKAAVPRADIEAFAQASGLGAPDSLLDGGGVYTLGLWLAVLPLLLLGILLLVQWAVAVGKRHAFAMKLALAVAAVVLALLLPVLLGLLPGWVIPPKWSDFSHWSNLFAQFGGFITSIFGLVPAARDVALKGTLVLLLALSALCSPLAVWLGQRVR